VAERLSVKTCGFGLVASGQSHFLAVRHFFFLWLSLLAVIGDDLPSPAWQPAQLFPHETVWASYDETGRVVRKFVEVASGLNRQLPDGSWVRSDDEIEIIEGGAIARNAQFTATFAATSNPEKGVAAITLPQNAGTLRVRCVGLAYTASNGQSVFIAEIRDVQGQRFSRNQIVYEDCFVGAVKADLRYIVKVGSIAQDVVLRSQLPPPQDFGLPDAKLEIWTEFIEAPEPRKATLQSVNAAGQQVSDCVLDFGPMQIGSGRAGAMDAQGNLSVEQSTRVNKQFESVGGVRFLIESAALDEITPHLEDLPASPRAAVDSEDLKQQFYANRSSLSRRRPLSMQSWVSKSVANSSPPVKHIAMNHGKPAPGYIIDFDLVSASTNYTFRSDHTYYVSGPVNLSGQTVFEGGTVVKYSPTNTSQLIIKSLGSILCKTDLYRPIVLCARDDNTVGESITNTTLSGLYADRALFFESGAAPSKLLREFRISRASYGVVVYGPNSDFIVGNGQFVGCYRAIFHATGKMAMRNVLFSGCPYPIQGQGIPPETAHISGEHLTINGSLELLYTQSGTVTYAFTNSLFINVASFGSPSFTSVSNYTSSSATGIFQAAGAGSHYILTNTLRNAGTTSIDAGLAADLTKRTTYPPTILTNCFGADTTLTNHAAWLDTDTPDLGYHYSPLDYLVNNTTITNATLTITNGAVLGLYNTLNFHLRDQAHIVSIGAPNTPNRFCDYYLVQENSTFLGNSNVMRFTFYPQQDSTNFLTDIQVRFTEFYGWNRYHIYEDSWLYADSIDIRDSYFDRGTLCLIQPNSSAAAAHLFNNVFERSAVWVDSTNGFTLYNNLHYEGWLNFTNRVTNTLTVKDCLFKDISWFNDVLINNSHNGYIGCPTRLSPLATNNVSLSSFTFTNGPLGVFYQHGDDFKDFGSRNATNAGLFHYTTKMSQIKETNSPVDIGPHYIAVDPVSGSAEDYDSDGTPNYQEDPNGNGWLDSGETPWSHDKDYDGVPTWVEIYDQTNPDDANHAKPYRLGYWKFEDAFFTGEPHYSGGARISTINSPNVSQGSSWTGSSSASFTSTGTPIPTLQYKETELDSWPNFNCRSGTVRFWIKPTWTSQPLSGGTGGPGETGSVIQIGDGNEYWQIYIDPAGTNLVLQCHTNIFYKEVRCKLQLNANKWTQLTVTYSATNIAFFTNGVCARNSELWLPAQYTATSGTNLTDTSYGIPYWPGEEKRNYGIGIGGGAALNNSWRLHADLDEVETFNYPLSAAQIAADFPKFVGYTGLTSLTVDSDDDGRTDLLETYVDGTNPNAGLDQKQMRLAFMRFNDASFMGEQGQIPTATNGISQVSSWSDKAVYIPATTSAALTYRDIELSGSANFTPSYGSVRFWFKRGWATNSNPPSLGSFVYVGSPTGGRWELRYDGSSSNLVLVTGGSGTLITNFTHSQNFRPDKWYQIVVTYDTRATRLFVDGAAAVTTGLPIDYVPSSSERANGLVIGNKTGGGQAINGYFEELETFTRVLSETEISESFEPFLATDLNLNGVADVLEDISLAFPLPFPGTPFVVTGVIEAEQFDKGGQNKGYYKGTSTVYSDYRNSRVQINPTTDLGLGYSIEDMRAGDWVQYSLDVRMGQTYCVEPRVLWAGTNAAYRIEFSSNGGSTWYTSLTNYVTSTTWTNGWTNVSATNIQLIAGYNTMRITVLTNGFVNSVDQGFAAKFNYISIYPWWNAGFTITTTDVISSNSLYLGTDWNSARSNAMHIQGRLNLASPGTSIQLPSGTYYVAQPPETNEATLISNEGYNHAALRIRTNNIAICGEGRDLTKLIGFNRMTTIIASGKFDAPSEAKANIIMRDIEFEGRPHQVSVTNTSSPYGYTNYFEGGTWQILTNGITNAIDNNMLSKGAGALVAIMGWGKSLAWPDAYASNILIENCRFRNSDRALSLDHSLTNVLVRSNEFICVDGPNEPYNPYEDQTNGSPHTVRSPWHSPQVLGGGGYRAGDLLTLNFNVVIVSNSYNGNPAITAMATDFASQGWATDGFVYFRSGGNYFVARNVITNYYLEAVYFTTGPSAVVQNEYGTYLNGSSTKALAGANVNPASNTITEDTRDSMISFIGNSVNGGGLGWASRFAGGEPNLRSLKANFCGNDIQLNAPWNPGHSEGDRAAGVFERTEFLNASGNKLRAGYKGITIDPLGTVSSLILKNDLNGANQGAIFVLSEAANGSAVIAKNILSHGRSSHVYGNTADATKVFVLQNTFRQPDTTNIVPAVYDRISLPVHFNP
jgi:hypothetical protein